MHILIFSFVVAFCSMSYELVLAQTVSMLYGSTLFNYTLIIGTFIFSLGLGAAMHARRTEPSDDRLFLRLELWLSVIGGAAPFIILAVEAFFQTLHVGLLTWFAAAYAFLIGGLSGMEIPVLIDLANRGSSQEGDALARKIRLIVGLDFVGTFVAAVVVPLACFPELGVLRTSAVVGIGNACVALWVAKGFRPKRALVAVAVSLIILASMAVSSDQLGRLLFAVVY